MEKGEYFGLVIALFIVMAAVIVSADPTWQIGFPNTKFNATEDTLFQYNFSQNVTNLDNESLNFRIEAISVEPDAGLGNNSLNYPWFSINSSRGMLTLNSTNDSQTGYFTVTVKVENASNAAGQSSLFYFNVTPVNDAPRWTGLTNRTFNMTDLFSMAANATDEENNIPFKLNITFASCDVAPWSTRNCSTEDGKQLFNSSQYSFNQTTGALNITFTPQRNDVGSYIIRFNITDSGNSSLPFNASYSQLVNYTVLVQNAKPYFTYVCDNERSATEGTPFSCRINATDIDEVNNLTARSNATGSFSSNNTRWFTFNGTTSSHMAAALINTSISFNASWLVNFTPTNYNVGNWSINITMNDTGSPVQSNSTAFYFFVSNTPDSVFLDEIPAITAYTSNNYTLYLNATDDDLLIPDKSVYNEILTFRSNNSNLTITQFQNSSNKTTARIVFNPNSLGTGSHMININVTDASGSSDFTLFNITVVNNTPPAWNPSTLVNFTLNENVTFYLNLSANVTDVENDPLSFSYSNDSAFPSFSLTSPGIINFTPADSDVGRHTLLINVTDGITPASLSFTFEVFNLNETPRISRPMTASTNVTVDPTTGALNFTEDGTATFLMNVRDDDFIIPSSQKSYYNESLTVNTTIQGPNTRLFNFTLSLAPVAGGNLSVYSSTFTPNKSDVGRYNVTIRVTDASGLNDTYTFNVTVSEINHDPTISAIANQTSTVNRTFTLDMNATDIEDGSDNGNLTYALSFLSGTDFVTTNQSIFNSTTGLLNVTFNDTQAGNYRINVTVTDSTGKLTATSFYLKVYDFPSFISPAADDIFNLTEQANSNLSFVVNHSVGDSLNYSFYINGSLRYSIVDTANGSILNWSFTPSTSDETYGGLQNLTLLVENSLYPGLNSSREFSLNISHSNARVSFNGTIPSQQKNYDQQITVNLSQYFSDVDSSDPFYNQTLNFSVVGNMSTNSTISVNVQNGSLMNGSLILRFSSGTSSLETFNITATDGQYSNYSNTFTVEFTPPSTEPAPNSRNSGGGGGGAQVKPVSLNIIVPGPLTARKQDRLIVPVALTNTGKITLNDILLRNLIAKNGILRDDLLASFDTSFFPTLAPGESKNLTLIVDINTRDVGLYEVTLNGTSRSPAYSDTAKLYINVEEGDTTAEKVSFTEEFIAQNPQCIEIKEIIDAARELYIQGDTIGATNKADEALEACKNAISQAGRAQVREKIYQRLTDNIGLASLIAVAVGIAYYWIRRWRMQSQYAPAASDDGKV